MRSNGQNKLETDDNLLSHINEKEETGARKTCSLLSNYFPGVPPPNTTKKKILPPARETENKLKKENALLAERSVKLMEEIVMLKATIQDLSDARKQMLQQQDDNKQLQQEISKLQDKNRQQKNLIQGLQPAKLQRLRQQLKQMKNKLQASKRMLRQHVAVQEQFTAEK